MIAVDVCQGQVEHSQGFKLLASHGDEVALECDFFRDLPAKSTSNVKRFDSPAEIEQVREKNGAIQPAARQYADNV